MISLLKHSLVFLISFGLCQQQVADSNPIDPNKLKKEQEKQNMGQKQNFFEFSEENFAETFMDFINKPKDTLPLLIIKVTSECVLGACVEYIKTANVVAAITKRQNRIAFLNCLGREGYLCDKFPDVYNKHDTETIYLRNNKIYVYEGEHTQEGLLEFFSADNWMNAKVAADDLEKHIEIMLDLKIEWSEWFTKKYNEGHESAQNWIQKKFKKVPHLGKWSSDAQLVLVSVTIIPPALFTTFYLILLSITSYKNNQINKKYEQLN